jgi:hypothetical protein
MSWKGVGVHPPPSPARANFTLMTECTPESSRYYSVYSVIVTVSKTVKKGLLSSLSAQHLLVSVLTTLTIQSQSQPRYDKLLTGLSLALPPSPPPPPSLLYKETQVRRQATRHDCLSTKWIEIVYGKGKKYFVLSRLEQPSRTKISYSRARRAQRTNREGPPLIWTLWVPICFSFHS